MVSLVFSEVDYHKHNKYYISLYTSHYFKDSHQYKHVQYYNYYGSVKIFDIDESYIIVCSWEIAA